MGRCLILIFLLTAAPVYGAGVHHAVILLYHHISEETPASTSVSPELFHRHLNYLDDNGFTVLELETVLDRLYSGRTVPDGTVVITFDDAYESVYTEAFPALARRDWPFTVLVADESVEHGYRHYMNWDQLRHLVENGVGIGAHSVTHAHLATPKPSETRTGWIKRVNREIHGNRQKLEQRLGVETGSFAYPYGEYSATVRQLVREAGLYGLAQHSGAVGRHTDPGVIPRFPMATGFADMTRFATALNTRPLPASEAGIGATAMPLSRAPETLILELAPGPYDGDRLRCFSSAGKILPVKREENRLTIDLPAFGAGRNKINCTAPSGDKQGEYFWYSRLWIMGP